MGKVHSETMKISEEEKILEITLQKKQIQMQLLWYAKYVPMPFLQ